MYFDDLCQEEVNAPLDNDFQDYVRSTFELCFSQVESYLHLDLVKRPQIILSRNIPTSKYVSDENTIYIKYDTALKGYKNDVLDTNKLNMFFSEDKMLYNIVFEKTLLHESAHAIQDTLGVDLNNIDQLDAFEGFADVVAYSILFEKGQRENKDEYIDFAMGNTLSAIVRHNIFTHSDNWELNRDVLPFKTDDYTTKIMQEKLEHIHINLDVYSSLIETLSKGREPYILGFNKVTQVRNNTTDKEFRQFIKHPFSNSDDILSYIENLKISN